MLSLLFIVKAKQDISVFQSCLSNGVGLKTLQIVTGDFESPIP